MLNLLKFNSFIRDFEFAVNRALITRNPKDYINAVNVFQQFGRDSSGPDGDNFLKIHPAATGIYQSIVIPLSSRLKALGNTFTGWTFIIGSDGMLTGYPPDQKPPAMTPLYGTIISKTVPPMSQARYPGLRPATSLTVFGSFPDLSNAYGADSVVQLPTGRVINLSDVDLNPQTQQFVYAGVNVTNYLTPDQKRLFPDFDIEAYNNQLYIDHMNSIGRPVNAGGSTSTLDLFTQNVGETLNNVGASLPALTGNISKIVIAGAVVYAIFTLVPLFKSTKVAKRQK